MTVWGIATALARILSNIDFNLFALTFGQWSYEVLVRLPHGLLPLALLLSIRGNKQLVTNPNK